MSFTKTLKIENKIFKKSDIQYFWDKINSKGETTLILEFEDGAKYSATDDKLLKNDELIDHKKCKEISIRHWNKKQNIYFMLSSYSSYNSIQVEGEDENWVSGTFENLKSKINSLPKHPKWIQKLRYRFAIGFLGQVIIQFSSFFILKIAFKSFLIDFIPGILGFIFSISTLLILPLIFPSIEFDFGPEDKNSAKNWRNRLKILFQFIFGVIILGIIIGLVTNYIYDQLKINPKP